MFCIKIIAILILILFLSKHSLCLEYYNMDHYYSRPKRMFCIEIIAILILIFQDKENVLYKIIAILILILFLSKHYLCLEYQNMDNYYSRTKRMFCIEIIVILILIFQDKENVLYKIIAILILILFLSKHSLCLEYQNMDHYYYRTKRMFWK